MVDKNVHKCVPLQRYHSNVSDFSYIAGSDDAQPPDFPTHVFGSRKDPPRKNGSMIPKMLSTDHRAVSAADVKGHVPREPEYSAAIDLTSSGKGTVETRNQGAQIEEAHGRIEQGIDVNNIHPKFMSNVLVSTFS